MIMKNHLSFIVILLTTLLTGCTPKDITIEWDSASCHFVCSGVYARIKPIDKSFAMVYSAGPSALIRFSHDNCKSWGAASVVAQAEGYNYTNCEILQLQNGTILYMWNARPAKAQLPFKIMYSLSHDGGKSWTQAQDLYVASTKFQDGCWEPVALQLPDGEVQIYFANEYPYTSSDEQEISLMRSHDNCATWSRAEKISFRSGSRDGMAVPIYLPHSKEIAIAIEDNGIRGRFKPVIVRTTENWHDGDVSAADPRREEAICATEKLHDTIYAGAPYLIRLGKSHTLLSIQSTEGRKGGNERYANMQVYVGDHNARHFHNRTTPMPDLPPNGNALWNSITQIDDKHVIAVMSVSGMPDGKNGIWTVTGQITKK